MVEVGCIRPSASPFASPVLVVKKPDGVLQFCVNYYELNTITIYEQVLLPCANNLVDALANSKVYSGLDLRSRYCKVCIAQEIFKYTAFVMQSGQWE